MSLERARRVADAVLYEGYVLFPYRASSRKNRYRWTFGVVAPRAWSQAGGCEPSSLRLECLVETEGAAPRIDGILRFLQVERRTVEAAQPDGGFARRRGHDGVDRRMHAFSERGPGSARDAAATGSAGGRRGRRGVFPRERSAGLDGGPLGRAGTLERRARRRARRAAGRRLRHESLAR